MTEKKPGQDGKAAAPEMAARAARRRNFLWFSGLAIVAAALPSAVRRFAPLPETRPIPGVPDFRLLETGAVTAGSAFNPLIGLNGGDAEDSSAKLPFVDPNRLCPALFGSPPPADAVAVAAFTDLNCALCQRMAPDLERLAVEGRIDLTWHDLGLLGPSSQTAALALTAARWLGVEPELRRNAALMRGAPGEAGVRRAARASGVDADRLLAEMSRPRTALAVWHTQAVAETLGLYATPGTVIFDIAALGYLDTSELARLVRQAPKGRWPCA